ncbi:MAG TPA: AAA family ATPase [Vitreimonas sp.]|nr:AAA family ATPase [Vitreimonas sp.]
MQEPLETGHIPPQTELSEGYWLKQAETSLRRYNAYLNQKHFIHGLNEGMPPDQAREYSQQMNAQPLELIEGLEEALKLLDSVELQPDLSSNPFAQFVKQETETIAIVDEASRNDQFVLVDGKEVSKDLYHSERRLFGFMNGLLQINDKIDKLEKFLEKQRLANVSSPNQSDVLRDTQIITVQKTLDGLYKMKREVLPNLNPEAFIATYLLDIRRMKREYRRTGVMSTEWVTLKEREIENTLTSLGMVAVVGETGTGKTKVAGKIARRIHHGLYPNDGDNSFEFIAGNKHTTKEDLFGYLGLDVRVIDPLSVPDQIIAAQKALATKNVKEDLGSAELEGWKRIIETVLIHQAGQKEMITKDFWGPVQRAMVEGRALIIDEFNYLDPGLLASLNEYSQLRPGQEVTLPNGTTVRVKKGFCIIFTGNISIRRANRYLQRSGMDPALLNRLGAALVEYNTPPLDGIDQAYDADIKKSAAGEFSNNKRDLYQIVLAMLCDEKGNLYAPAINGRESDELFNVLWRLAHAFKTLQNNYAGLPMRKEDSYNEIHEVSLEKTHTSMRTLTNLLKDWKQEAYQYDLEHYIIQHILRPASIMSPSEAEYIYHVFKVNGFFQTDSKWSKVLESIETPEQGVNDLRVKDYNSNDFKRDDIQVTVYNTWEVAEAFSGRSVPREIRAEKLGNPNEKISHEEVMGFYRSASEQLESFKTHIENMQNALDAFCADETKINELTGKNSPN